jgi:hypothetical protein
LFGGQFCTVRQPDILKRFFVVFYGTCADIKFGESVCAACLWRVKAGRSPPVGLGLDASQTC